MFAQLEKLGDDDLTGDELESELKRTDAICDISEQIIKNGEIPSWIDPDKFKILKRTVVEIAGDWKEAKREKDN